MRSVLVPVLLGLQFVASPAVAGDESAPRPLAQRGAKAALGETRLDDADITAVYADLEKFAGAWARHVRDVGAAAARKEDTREVVDAGVRDALYARGLALSAQEALIDAMVLRAEAILRDYERVLDGQSKVKRALEGAFLEDPQLSQVFREILDLADNGFGWVQAPGAADADRIPAAKLVSRELAPLFERAEVGEKHAAKISAAVAQWLEARAAFEVELER